MIERYTKKEIGDVWTDYNNYVTWLEVELAVCEAWRDLGELSDAIVEDIKIKADIDVNRIHEIEKDVKHNVIAFLTSIAEKVGDSSRFIHKGLTSSDVLDTALSLQINAATYHLLSKIDVLLESLKKKAFEYKDTLMMGRSHGMHAEPITFGIKLANWYSEMSRNKQRLIDAWENMRYGKISGAVGTYAHIPPKLEELVCKKLGLKQPDISSQILQRDRHAQYITTLAIVGASLEKIATEIRHLARTEIHEVEEPFTENQKGSSAMPHKRNPIRSENICGCSRVLRGYVVTAMENVTLWHERDISHSSAERIIFPDATILLYHMLTKTINIIDNMVVYPDIMAYNMQMSNGVYTAQKILLTLVKYGMLREDAYKIVQECAMKAIERGDFRVLLKKHLNPTLYNIVSEEFDDDSYVKNVDYTFDKVFGKVNIEWDKPESKCATHTFGKGWSGDLEIVPIFGGGKKDVKWIKVEDQLPPEGKYVLGRHNRSTWRDSDDQDNVDCVVVKLVKGISKEYRERRLRDTSLSIKEVERLNTFTRADEDGNNEKNYCWESFGPDYFFSQEIFKWCFIPEE